MASRDVLLSTIASQAAVQAAAEERRLPSEGSWVVGGAASGGFQGALPSHLLSGLAPAAGGRSLPLALAVRLAAREDIDEAMAQQRPPEQGPELPLSYASDLATPTTYQQAVNSEHRELWIDAMKREVSGLIEGCTFAPCN